MQKSIDRTREYVYKRRKEADQRPDVEWGEEQELAATIGLDVLRALQLITTSLTRIANHLDQREEDQERQ